MNSSVEAITQVPQNKKYLEDIGVTEPLQKRIEEIHSFIQRIYPCKVLDFFIEDYIKEDGTRMYTNIDFCTDRGFFTAMDFISSMNISMSIVAKHIVGINFQAKDYDFVKASENSRLLVHCEYEATQLYGEFRATGLNCEYLMKYIREHFLSVMHT